MDGMVLLMLIRKHHALVNRDGKDERDAADAVVWILQIFLLMLFRNNPTKKYESNPIRERNVFPRPVQR
jgi:hypothetical protein